MVSHKASNNEAQTTVVWHKYQQRVSRAVCHQANQALLISPGICSDLVQVVLEKMGEHILSD